MGYSLPAALGAAIANPDKQVICFIGDGGLQLNIQELQTLRYHNLNVKVFVFNNFGYGIVKQFQDLYFEGRHHATGLGYSQVDFGAIAQAYNIPFVRVESERQLSKTVLETAGPAIVDLVLHASTLIEPKLEMGHSIEDQFPYLDDREYAEGMRFSINQRQNKN